MTTAEQLALCDALEYRALANLTYARENFGRRYEPNFVMIPQIWSMPRPEDPSRERRVFMAGLVTGLCGTAAFALILILVQP